MFKNYRGNTGKSTIFIINLILTLSISANMGEIDIDNKRSRVRLGIVECGIEKCGRSESYPQQRPRIVSGPSHPLISTSQGKATFNWTFVLWPGMTWNESVVEMVFGVWKPSGILDPKLLVVTKQENVLIRPNFEKKVTCEFNISRLQVAFTLHNLSVLDEMQYGFQVEFGLAYNPLTDAVMLRLQDPPKIVNPLKRNFYLKTGASLNLTCAAEGLPRPQVTWTRLGRQIKNQTLVFKQLTKEDSGLYLCKASNAAGEDTIEVNVTAVDDEESMQAMVLRSTTSEHVSGQKWRVILLATVTYLFIVWFSNRSYDARLSPL